jgi:RNA polymerase sigma-70 factor (ECF subfamily)
MSSRSRTQQADSSTALQARFQELVLPHLDRLVSFASRRLGNAADAEDVVQDSFVRAWLGFRELRDESRIRPWLYQIVRSVMSDFRERRGRREHLAPTMQLEQAREELAVSEEPGPFERLVDSISTGQVHEVLRMLPESFAIAVELHDIEGFRYHEIAEITGVPLGTVMSRIYRGRKLLAGLIVTHEANWDLAGRWSGMKDRRTTKRTS